MYMAADQPGRDGYLGKKHSDQKQREDQGRKSVCLRKTQQ